MLIKICTYFLVFLIFSVVGWITETLLYIIRDGKAVKRGFLFGPLCPIYGFAALVCDLLIYGILDNIVYIAIAGFLFTGILEYVTHFAMEKLFHAMWWDYSDRKFNVNGRIYLKGLLFFAAGSVFIVKVALPLIYDLVDIMPEKLLYTICFVLYTVLIADLATTFADLKGTIRALKHIQHSATAELQKGVDTTAETFDQIKKTILESKIYRRAISENKVLIDFKREHPSLTLTNYKYMMDLIGDRPDNKKKRKDIKLYGTAETIPDENDAKKSEAGAPEAEEKKDKEA